jgi:hypothetical protein
MSDETKHQAARAPYFLGDATIAKLQEQNLINEGVSVMLVMDAKTGEPGVILSIQTGDAVIACNLPSEMATVIGINLVEIAEMADGTKMVPLPHAHSRFVN